jgi:hypothetical protein
MGIKAKVRRKEQRGKSKALKPILLHDDYAFDFASLFALGSLPGKLILTAKDRICYKTCSRRARQFLVARRYSAVAQWQSIRLLTEGL